MKEIIYNYLASNKGDLTLLKAIEILTIALILAFVVFLTYKITFSGVLYNRKFNISLVMLTLVTTIVMLVIGSDIALSLGMVGALSIVRFRTAIKDPRDTAYIFWCVAIGLCVGTQNYMIAIVGSFFICIILSLFGIGGIGREDRYILIIRGARLKEEEIMKCVFSSFKGCHLRAKNSSENSIELVYQIKIKGNNDQKIIDSLYDIGEIDVVNIVAQNGETIG